MVVTIYDSTGGFVKTFESQNLVAGQHTLMWDGTDKEGDQAADGSYTFEILAADASGEAVTAKTFFTGSVDKVTFENNTPFLISEGHKIALGDVIQVSPAADSAINAQIEEQNNTLTDGGI